METFPFPRHLTYGQHPIRNIESNNHVAGSSPSSSPSSSSPSSKPTRCIHALTKCVLSYECGSGLSRYALVSILCRTDASSSLHLSRTLCTSTQCCTFGFSRHLRAHCCWCYKYSLSCALRQPQLQVSLITVVKWSVFHTMWLISVFVSLVPLASNPLRVPQLV